MDQTPTHHTLMSGSWSDPGEGANILSGVVVTLLLHGLAVLLMAWATMSTNKALDEYIEPKVLEFEDVELLALGKERPPQALPRIANPAPAPRRKNEIVLNKPDPKVVPIKKEPEPTEEKEPEVKTQERRKKLVHELDDLFDPERPTNDDVPAGHESGAVGGTLSDIAKSNLVGNYATKLKKEFSRVWTMPATVPAHEIIALQGQVVVAIYLSKTGYIRSYTWLKKSKNEQFNMSIELVIRRFQLNGGGRKLPLPDNEEVKQLVLKEALNLKQWEYTGH